YPTYVRFFSTAEKLSIGGLPFIVAGEKPTRRDALAYYRGAVRYFNIPLRQYERVASIERTEQGFAVHSSSRSRGEQITNPRAGRGPAARRTRVSGRPRGVRPGCGGGRRREFGRGGRIGPLAFGCARHARPLPAGVRQK